MGRTETALKSLLDGDEELLETWRVDTINRGFELSPPGMGASETLGLTDRRLVWLDDELETVELDDIIEAEKESIQPSSSPVLFTLGTLALVLGIIATPVLFLLADLTLIRTVAPLAGGIGLFVLTTVASRLRSDDDDGERQYYLEVKTARTTVQVYATEPTVEEMVERLEAHAE